MFVSKVFLFVDFFEKIRGFVNSVALVLRFVFFECFLYGFWMVCILVCFYCRVVCLHIFFGRGR